MPLPPARQSRRATAPARRAPRAACVVLGAVVGVAVAACGDDGGSDAAAFCADVRADVASVVSPSLATPEELDATLERYRELGDLAPAAIAEEWGALVLNLETAATVVPGDPDSVQRAVAQAYATERSAVVVADWLRANCAVELGPVATIVPQARPTPATAPPVTGGGTTPPLGTEPAG